LINIGDKIKVTCGDYDSKRFSTTRKVIGKVVYINKDYFTLFVERYGKPAYRESFLFKDKNLIIQEVNHGVLDRRSMQAV